MANWRTSGCCPRWRTKRACLACMRLSWRPTRCRRRASAGATIMWRRVAAGGQTRGVRGRVGSARAGGGNGSTSMLLVISLAVSAFGMSVTEALRAATVGGARALRAPDRGGMARGRAADIVAWDADHEGAFAWSYGMKPIRVWRGGEPVTT